ncbi:MAG TPA: acetate--CoA ligase family protein, partial [Chloroflexota bacterium]
MTSNGRMLDVFRNSGFLIEVASGNGVVHLTFPTELTVEALERFEQREQIAACSALAAFLKPSSIAVIGASRRRGTPGGEVFHNLLAGEFRGPVYPINPAAESVQSVAAYRSIGDVPRMVDLAVIAVPADQVLEVAQECAEKRIHSLLVLSAGFAEIGGQGRERQQELLSFCRQNGMRLIGPNCIGVTNTSPAVRLDATFGPLAPPRGRVGFMSQSGALGIAAMAYAAQRGLGISSFVSVGNKADISGNDLLKYWESDPDTDVIVLYLESFGNPRKFARIAQRVGKQKPIVVVKSGRSPAGARATSSHTGAMVASSDVTVDALFRQVGVIRTDTLEELFDAVTLLANQPLPAGRRVALITNAGGPAILCADACVASGLDVPQLSLETQARLQEFLPAFASVTNPVDMIATATAEDYARTLAAVAADPNIDSIIVLFIQPLATRSEDVAKVILDAARMLERHKPVLAALMSLGGSVPSLTAADVAIPTYAFPESAAVALGHAARYAEWARRPTPLPFHPADIRVGEALALVARARDRGADWLDPKEAADLLACYGLPLIEQRLAGSAEDAGQIAVDLGGPIALKGMAPGIVHKTEAGLVRLNLEGRDAVAQAARDILSAIDIGDRPAVQLLIQRMAAPGVEMLVGVVNDPQFGPLIACGAGGVLVELLKDVSLGLTP